MVVIEHVIEKLVVENLSVHSCTVIAFNFDCQGIIKIMHEMKAYKGCF